MSDEISDERVEQAIARLTTTRYLCTKCGWNGWEPRRRGQALLCAECDYCPVGFEPDPDVLVVISALRAARQRAREAEAKLREPRWYFDDGESVDPDDKAAELPPGSAFRLDGARPTGTHYFRADALGSNEITEAEYTAALAAAESAAATGGGT